MTFRRFILILIACLALGLTSAAAQEAASPQPELTVVLTPLEAATDDGAVRADLYRDLVIDGIAQASADVNLIESDAAVTSHADARALATDNQAAMVVWGDADAMTLHLTLDEAGANRPLSYERQVIYSQLAPLDQVDFVLADAGDRQWAQTFIGALIAHLSIAPRDSEAIGAAWDTASDRAAFDSEPAPGDTSRAALHFYRASGLFMQYIFPSADSMLFFDESIIDSLASFDLAQEAFPPEADSLVRAALLHNHALTTIRTVLMTSATSDDFISRGRVLTANRALTDALALLTEAGTALDQARTLRIRATGFSVLSTPEDDPDDVDSPSFRLLADVTEAAALLSREREPVAYSAVHNDLGSVLSYRYFLTGDITFLRDAADAYDASASALNADISAPATFEALYTVGEVYLQLAESDDPLWYRVAARAFRDALALPADDILPDRRADAAVNLASASLTTAYATGESDGLEGALDALNEVAATLDANLQAYRYANVQQWRGQIALAYGTLEDNSRAVGEAIDYFNESLALHRDQDNFGNVSFVLNSLARAYILTADQGVESDVEANLLLAEAALDEALTLADSYGGITITFAQIDLASVLVRLSEYGQERVRLRRAVDLFEAGLRFPPDSPFAEGEALRLLGDAYLGLREERSACDAWSRAAAAYTAGGAREAAADITNLRTENCPDAALPDLGRDQGELVVGEQRGRIAVGGTTFWTYSGVAGEEITVRVNADNPSNTLVNDQRQGTLDTVVRIYAPDGSLLAEEDDIVNGTVTDSAIVDLVLPVSGTYSIQVASYDNATGGAFTVTLLTRART